MQLIGFLGGMSGESSVQYYRIVNVRCASGWGACTRRGA